MQGLDFLTHPMLSWSILSAQFAESGRTTCLHHRTLPGAEDEPAQWCLLSWLPQSQYK